MNIDIAQIINEKLKKLEEAHTIENAIDEVLEKSMLKVVTDALDGCQLKHEIEQRLSYQVGRAVADIDFATYKGFIEEQLKRIVEEVCKDDLREKIQKTLEGIFLCKRENVKLSEFFKAYREYVCEKVDDIEKERREHFHVKLHKNPACGWYECEMDEEKLAGRRDFPEIKFIVHDDKDGSGRLGTVNINGKSLFDLMVRSLLTSAELLLAQAACNRLPIILDIDDENDIDCSYDINWFD